MEALDAALHDDEGGWSLIEEIALLKDIARFDESAPNRMAAADRIHKRRLEALKLAGAFEQITQSVSIDEDGNKIATEKRTNFSIVERNRKLLETVSRSQIDPNDILPVVHRDDVTVSDKAKDEK